jgi:glycosyltransferase involved in cell wall biosynthesis
LPFAAPVAVVGHSCVLSWWRAVKNEDAPSAEWRRYREAIAAGWRAADAVVAPSSAMLAAIDRHYGPLPPSHVIYNGRVSTPYRPGPKEPLILSAGRLWDEAKNVAALATAAASLAWPVYVAGDDRSPDGSRRAFQNVVTLGRLNERELASWYARATVYALPARYEPFGLSALDAAHSGCALLLGDIASLREVWRDALVYVVPDDPRAIGQAIAALIADRQTCAEYARRARCRAAAFTMTRVADEYLALYRTLCRPEPCVARDPAGITASAPAATSHGEVSCVS